jgi:hypothetical protein
MKKYYTESKYKKWNTTRSKKTIRSKQKRNKYDDTAFGTPVYNFRKPKRKPDPVIAPLNLCLLENTEECLVFFQKIRKRKSVGKIGRSNMVQMDLSNVAFIDYSTVCVLIAIITDLKNRGIFITSNLPKSQECKQKVLDCGLLNVMYDNQGRPFKRVDTSDLHFIEKGSKKLTKSDNRRISETVRRACQHLSGSGGYNKRLRTILLEICGNSIEWGGTQNRQWLLGVKYENDRAIFTVTDVGVGILNTLKKKPFVRLSDVIQAKSDDDVLRGAFIKKYGSSSQKINRNKGLPSIRTGFEDGLLRNLKVLTNNVILHYDNESNSGEFRENLHFKGTLYRWVVTQESLKIN